MNFPSHQHTKKNAFANGKTIRGFFCEALGRTKIRRSETQKVKQKSSVILLALDSGPVITEKMLVVLGAFDFCGGNGATHYPSCNTDQGVLCHYGKKRTDPVQKKKKSPLSVESESNPLKPKKDQKEGNEKENWNFLFLLDWSSQKSVPKKAEKVEVKARTKRNAFGRVMYME